MADGCALYIRVSTLEQDLSGQERELRTYALSHSWEVVMIYKEKVSATGKVLREEYERLLRDSAEPNRPWKHLIVWSMDRFSREERFTRAIENIWELERHGIHFHSVKEPAIDTPGDGGDDLGRNILRAILPIISSFESRRRSERVKVAMIEIKSGRRQTRSGKPPGRPRRAIPDKLNKAYTLRREGHSWASVARHVGIPAETIRAAMRRYKP